MGEALHLSAGTCRYQKRASDPLEAGVTGHHEMPDKDARN